MGPHSTEVLEDRLDVPLGRARAQKVVIIAGHKTLIGHVVCGCSSFEVFIPAVSLQHVPAHAADSSCYLPCRISSYNRIKARDAKVEAAQYYSWWEVWTKSQHRRDLKGYTAQPSPAVVIDNQFNTGCTAQTLLYTPARQLTDKDRQAIHPLLDHQQKYFCGADQDDFDYWIQWQAAIVQRPQDKTGVCPLFKGLPGTGKGMLLGKGGLLGNLIGEDFYLQAADFNSITGNFNSLLKNKWVMAQWSVHPLCIMHQISILMQSELFTGC